MGQLDGLFDPLVVCPSVQECKNVQTLYGNTQGLLEKRLKIMIAGDLSASGCYLLSFLYTLVMQLVPEKSLQPVDWKRVAQGCQTDKCQTNMQLLQPVWKHPRTLLVALLFWHQECFICIYLMHSTKTATSQLFCIIENCVHKLLFSIKSRFGLHFIVISKQYNASFLA